MNSNDEDLLLSTLNVMRQQEDDAYRVNDYLSRRESHFSSVPVGSRAVDVVCRFAMAEWCYKVVDFCRYDRSVVSITMSYLDRFLSTNAGQETLGDRGEFQLVVMTCLYTAVKLFEPLAIHPNTLAALSNGAYTAKQIEDMEKIILQALDWHLNPPTATAFLQHFMEIIPSDTIMMIKPAIREAILDLSKIQIELSVCDYEFATMKPSVIAFCSLLNAVEIIDEEIVDDLRSLLEKRALMDLDEEVIERTRTRLFALIEKRPGSTIHTLAAVAHLSTTQSEPRSSVYSSPRSVVKMR